MTQALMQPNIHRKECDTPVVLAIDVDLPKAHLERIRGAFNRKQVIITNSPEALHDAEVVFTYTAAFDSESMPHLRWVQLNTAAIEHVQGQPIARSGVPIANARGAYSVAVAEFAFGMLLMLTRRLNQCYRLQSQGKWLEEYGTLEGENCYGKTMGIIGYGSIGRHIARIAQAMGIKVLACKQRPDQRPDRGHYLPNSGDPDGKFPHAWYGCDQLSEMLRQSDIAVCTLPITSATRNLLGPRELDALPMGAYLLGVGRGGVIDEDALVDHLKSGKLAGAGMDVFASEPLDKSSPLWHLPNVIIAPHIASYTDRQEALATDILIDNLKRDLAGRELVNLVDLERGY